jgi:hypothetical protein
MPPTVPINHYSDRDSNELPLEPGHLGVPSGVSKTNYVPMVRLVQTAHVSCARGMSFVTDEMLTSRTHVWIVSEE